MPLYVITRKADGAEVYRYSNDVAIEWQGFEFATHEHVALPDEAPPEPPPEPARPRWITKLAFRNRFTRAEKTAIEFAAADNPSASTQLRMLAASLRADLADQAQALYIDLDRVDTRAGVRQLEVVGLIAAGRADEILGAPVQPVEVYRG